MQMYMYPMYESIRNLYMRPAESVKTILGPLTVV